MTYSQPGPAPAGWYTDPSGVPGDRWWDGTAWSSSTRPTPTPEVPAYQTMQSWGASPYVAQPSGYAQPYGYGLQTGAVWNGNPLTGFMWALAAWPLLSVVTALVGIGANGLSSAYSPVEMGLNVISYFAFVGVAVLDNRELKSRGFPQPFGWGWGFLPVVYIIGRSVVAYNRTRRGLGPIWVWIGSQVASFVLVVTLGLALVMLGLA